MIRIKDIPIQERPMERLLQYGPERLNNEELLAILLKTGSKEQSAKEIASLLLSHVDKIQDISLLTKEQLLKFKGIGPMKASSLLAALELGKRMHQTVDQIQGKKFQHAELIFDYYKETLSEKKQECVYCIYLDQRKRIIKDELLFLGTINYSMIHPREIFKEAYLASACNIICVHNHPSGDVTPSKDDYEMTRAIQKAGALLGIPLLDHIIIGKNGYYSFFENNQIS